MDTAGGAQRWTAGLNAAERALAKQQDFCGLPARGALIVNESGFYKLVLKSRKPKARKFQDWVTGTVLPRARCRSWAGPGPDS